MESFFFKFAQKPTPRVTAGVARQRSFPAQRLEAPRIGLNNELYQKNPKTQASKTAAYQIIPKAFTITLQQAYIKKSS